MSTGCPLCAGDGGVLLWRAQKLRIIAAAEPDFPGFLRIIWQEHVAEMSDLPDADRALLHEVLLRTERTVRQILQPHKINLASLGNMVPHLHWHVIPRWPDDRSFPDSVWSPARRSAEPGLLLARQAQARALGPALQEALSGIN
jgi:diadenosine tetraphosphate (Ap4A) HIT family hydrolase